MRRLSILVLLMLVLALLAVGPATAEPPEVWKWEWTEEFVCDQGHTLSVEGHATLRFKLLPGDREVAHDTGRMDFRREETGDSANETWSVVYHWDFAEDIVCVTGTMFHMTLPGEGIVHQDAGKICYSDTDAFFNWEIYPPTFSAGNHEFWLGRPDTYGIDYRTYCEEWAD